MRFAVGMPKVNALQFEEPKNKVVFKGRGVRVGDDVIFETTNGDLIFCGKPRHRGRFVLLEDPANLSPNLVEGLKKLKILPEETCKELEELHAFGNAMREVRSMIYHIDQLVEKGIAKGQADQMRADVYRIHGTSEAVYRKWEEKIEKRGIW